MYMCLHVNDECAHSLYLHMWFHVFLVIIGINNDLVILFIFRIMVNKADLYIIVFVRRRRCVTVWFYDFWEKLLGYKILLLNFLFVLSYGSDMLSLFVPFIVY